MQIIYNSTCLYTKQKGLAVASPSTSSPSTLLRHRNRFRVLPTVLAKPLFQCEQAGMDFAQCRNICIIAHIVEEVKHRDHLFVRSASPTSHWWDEFHGSSNYFGEGIRDLSL